MTSEARKISITLVPGLEDMIQTLAEQRYGADARGEPVEVNLETLLPDLVNEGMAVPSLDELQKPVWPSEGGVVEFGPGEDGNGDPDIRATLEEAERQLSEPKVELPLEVRPEGPGVVSPEKVPSFDELTAGGRVHPDAVTWARGNPAREAALVETCLGLHPALWGLSQVPSMVERTYNARTQGSDI